MTRGHTITTDFGPPDAAAITALLVELDGGAGRARIGRLRDDGLSYWIAVPTGSSGPAGSLAARSGPAHATALGQVLLAHADDELRSRVLTSELAGRAAAEGTAVRERLQTALSVARLSGVAITRPGGPGDELGVAVPVLDDDGRVVAGLEVGTGGFDQVAAVLPGLLAASRRVRCRA